MVLRNGGMVSSIAVILSRIIFITFFYRILSEKLLRKVYQVQLFRSPCNSRIQPAQIFDVQHFVVYPALINKDALPLPTLRLVTGNCVSIFYLQSIEKRIFPDCPVSLRFRSDLRIILGYRIV